jgi:hypothetical protein
VPALIAGPSVEESPMPTVRLAGVRRLGRGRARRSASQRIRRNAAGVLQRAERWLRRDEPEADRL